MRTPAAARKTAQAHLRTLTAIHDSLFAPRFRALEAYGALPPAPPSRADVAGAARDTLAWHRAKEAEAAAHLAARRAEGAAPALIDRTARLLAHHRAERARVAEILASLEAPRGRAAG